MNNTHDFSNSNLLLLKEYHPHIYKKITDTSPDPVGEVFISSTGKYNLKVKNDDDKEVNLHDLNDPEAEAKQFLEMVSEESNGAIALMGMGLGYSSLALLQQRPKIRHLIVFELDPSVFLQAMKYTNLEKMLSDNRLILSIGKDPDIGSVLVPTQRCLLLESIHMLKHMPSFSYNNAGYTQLSEEVYKIASSYNMEGQTKLHYGKKFLTNRLSFLTMIHHTSLLESLRDAFSGKPAILVAGGPSLDENIHFLSKAKNKAVIICVDTVLPALIANNIMPDFVTSIDYKDNTVEKIADSAPNVKDVSLICMSWVDEKVPKIFPFTNIFWAFAGNYIERWINASLGGSLSSGGAGTAAQLNLISSIIMGCSPIIFVGQDLAYTEGKDYASNVVLGNTKVMNKQLEDTENRLDVKGIDGSILYTSRQLYSYKSTIETTIKNNQGHYINATAKGAHIEGTEILSLDDALKQHCTSEINILKNLEYIIKNKNLLTPNKLFSEIQSKIKTIKSLKKIIKKSDSITQKLIKEFTEHPDSYTRYHSLQSLPKQIQDKIIFIETSHNKIDDKRKVWELVDELTLEGVRKSERMKQSMVSLEGNSSKYMEWLLTGLERLESINRVRADVLDVFESELKKFIVHRKKEKQIRGALKKEGHKEEKLLELAELYFNVGDLILAKPVLDNLYKIMPKSPEVNFYLGAIAFMRSEYKNGELYFSNALKYDEQTEIRIEEFRKKLGDQYLNYANIWKEFDDRTVRQMLSKGLRYDINHNELKTQLSNVVQEDLEKIDSGIETDNFQEAAELTENWIQFIENNRHLHSRINKDQLAELYTYNGNFLIKEKNIEKAVASFEKAIEFAPDNPTAFIYITDILFTQKEYDLGIEYLKKAVELDRAYALYWERIGRNLQKADKFEDAISAYEQCFIILPEKTELLSRIGDCYLQMGRQDAAREAFKQLKKISSSLKQVSTISINDANKIDKFLSCEVLVAAKSSFDFDIDEEIAAAKEYQYSGNFDKAAEIYKKILDIKTDHSESLYMLGMINRKQENYSASLALMEQAVNSNPNVCEYYHEIGDTLQIMGRIQESVKYYQKSLEQKSDYHISIHNLGRALSELGKTDEAIYYYNEALKIKPDHADTHYNMGIAYRVDDKLDQAFSCFTRAIELNPEFVEAYNYIGLFYQSKGRMRDALFYYKKTLDIKPDYVLALNNMGTVLQDMEKIEESIECFSKAFSLNTKSGETLNNLIDQLQFACEWKKIRELLSDLDVLNNSAFENNEVPPETPFSSLKKRSDPKHHLEISKAFSKHLNMQYRQNILNREYEFNNRPSSKEKITVGYISNDFKNHAVSHILSPLIELHDRDKFRILCYSYGQDDDSVYRSRIKNGCDSFIDIANCDHKEAADIIYNDKVDILVELKGYTHSSRLNILAHRPAPIQVSYLGFLGTTGTDFIDYFISDKIVTPEKHTRFFTEKFVYMPHCYQVTDYSFENEMMARSPEEKKNDLQKNSIVFCSFNQPYKFEPEMFNVWMNILNKVSGSILCLRETNCLAKSNLKKEAQSRNIDPDRIVFLQELPLHEHLNRLKNMDIALDTRIYNGGATTSNCLWAGVPVVTLKGDDFVSRMSSSALSAIGMNELICNSLEEYEDLAVKLALNQKLLDKTKNQIIKNRKTFPLFDSKRFIKNLETGYKKMVELFAAGKKLQSIEIEEMGNHGLKTVETPTYKEPFSHEPVSQEQAISPF